MNMMNSQREFASLLVHQHKPTTQFQKVVLFDKKFKDLKIREFSLLVHMYINHCQIPNHGLVAQFNSGLYRISE